MVKVNNVSPKYSFIVPVYKVEEYLARCVESILNQTNKDFELILVDDGSPDGCGTMCDAFASKDKRIKVIHKENGGVSSARNEGIKIAKGEYIWFVDSDDYIEEDALEILSGYIEKDRADLYVFQRRINEKYEITDLDKLFCEHYFKYHFGFEPWNKIYSRSVIAENNLLFDTEETVGEDLLFNVNYYTKIRSCLFLDEDLYHYVVRENSAMTTKDGLRYKKQMRLYFKICQVLKGKVSDETLAVLFVMHIISGLNQSFNSFNFCRSRRIIKAYLSQAQFDRKTLKNAINAFLRNENASVLGRIRIKALMLIR